ncbi:MAG: acetate--CoA ligase family protein [Calditrichaeota bacterium]|nr:acetate--CoA ligase family protein [Calditrichota bacterium]MCB9367679.1 acetate--CoA ligase family protein [Calditrichota bacterium]
MSTQSPPVSDLNPIFKPRSIAVVGAGRRPGTIGRDLLKKLLDFGFNGIVYPVNPTARFINSMRAYRSVLEIPDTVDMAVICVPKELAMQAVDDCGRKDIKSIIMITAGFAETGEEGAKLERKLLEKVKSYGIRMIGPNSMGVINTDPEVSMDATFAGPKPVPGNIGFLSQSGALGVAILERTTGMMLGLSSFVSLGNRTDVSVDDVLAFWRDDNRTDLVLLYIESFGNAQRFIQVARDMVRTRPIIAVKSGRTGAGARAASSHTASLAATDVAVDAIFESAGILRVDTVEKLFDYAQAFATQPLPKGKRVAVISNGGGPAILATDAVEGAGLTMTEFSPETTAKLKSVLADLASARNPVDMVSSAGTIHFETVVNEVLNDPNVDAAIVLFVLPVTTDSSDIARGIASAYTKNKHLGKPVLVCFMTRDGDLTGTPILRKAGLPVYIFPESAVHSLAAMHHYREIRDRRHGAYRTFEDVNKDKVAKILKKAASEDRSQLNPDEVMDILAAYKFPLISSVHVKKREALVETATKIGFPVVMKIDAEGITHKSDVGGVRLNLRDAKEVETAYDEIAAALSKLKNPPSKWSVILEPMISGGREIVMGITSDPVFGPLIMVGMGGIYVEVLKDVSFRLAPLADTDIESMLTRLRGYPILKGVRGEKSVDFDRVTELLQRLSQLATDFTEIKELDINPILAFPQSEKCVVVDARIKT